MLTHRSVEALRQAEAPYRVPDQRCKGLAVRVAPSGMKTWDLAYRIRGTKKMRRLSLGRASDVSLEQARERANELTSAARGGRDLIGEEDEARAAAASRITVGTLIDLYLRRRVAGRPRKASSRSSVAASGTLSLCCANATLKSGAASCSGSTTTSPHRRSTSAPTVVAGRGQTTRSSCFSSETIAETCMHRVMQRGRRSGRRRRGKRSVWRRTRWQRSESRQAQP
jgi:hypothetical protein